MILEELAYKVTVRAEDFLSGKKKVEEGAKGLNKDIHDSMKDSAESVSDVTDEVKKAGNQLKRTSEDTRRPFGLISGGFLKAAKGAKEFGSEGKSAFSEMQLGAAKYLGLALSIEGTRRLFTSATSSLVDLGNASSFLDMDPKKLEGFQRGAKAVGASAEAMTNTLMRLKNAKNWSDAPMGAPDEFTETTLRLGTQTGVDIIGAKDPGEMFKRAEEALRKLPKEQAETYSRMLGIDASMLPSILDKSFDEKQDHYQKNSNASEEMIEKAKQVTAVMEDMDQTIKNLGNDLVLAFGGKVIDVMNEFDSWVTTHKGDIIGFFKDGAEWANRFKDAVGGGANALNALLLIKNPYLAAGVYVARKANEIDEGVTKRDGTKSFWQSVKDRWNAGGWYNHDKSLGEQGSESAPPPNVARKANEIDEGVTKRDGTKSFWQSVKDRWNAGGWYNHDKSLGEQGSESAPPPNIEPEQHAQSARRKRSNQFGMDALMNAVMMTESRGNPNAVSPAGAVGAYQFMPDTARDMGLRVDESVDERKDPAKSRSAATKYMNQLLNRYGGNIELALMAYNGGMGRVDNALKGNGKPLAQETLDYPGKVADYYQQISEMAGMQGVAGMQTQSVDNSQTTSNHYGTIQLNTNPQSIDEIAKSIDEQRRRSTMTGAFISGNG